MYIKNIKLENFRNYEKQEITIDKDINIFYGENGEGKTNIIEAIFICSMGKSYRTIRERELIRFYKEKAVIDISYKKIDRQANIKIEIEDKKNIFLNKIKLKKLSELIGNLNIVIFSPEDIEILRNGPSKRRKFLNIMISQLKPNYLHTLNLYIRTLEQRNNYLKKVKLENKEEDLLDIWDQKLYEYGKIIYEYRTEFINKIRKRIKQIHKEITQEKENIEIKYVSDFEDDKEYINKLKKSRKNDIVRGYTQYGIHKDDFLINLNGNQVNIYGSQGQHRTAILSLKLAELKIVQDEIGETPILLLDDFMSELDEKRRRNLIEHIKDIQVFITCTDKMELENKEYDLFYVKQGVAIKEENKR